MSDFFKFEYIDPKNIILNKNKEDYGTIVDGTKSGIDLKTFQQPTDINIKSEFIGGDVQEIISIRNLVNTTQFFGESINNIDDYGPAGLRDSLIIYQTGIFYNQPFSRGPYLRLGKHNIISEKNDSKLGIGLLFPAEKVHISGGNLRVEGNVFANNLYTKDNPSGFITSQNVVFITGNQTISGLKFFVIRPQVNGTGILLSGEAYPSNNPSGFITGIDTSSLYPRSNPSGFITGVDLSAYATVNNLALTGSNLQTQINNINSSGFITGVDLSSYATKVSLESTGSNLNSKINSLSGSSVLLYGTQSIDGLKRFNDQVYIKDLYVTGTQTIVNTTNTNVGSNYVLLNATGGAIDAGIFIVTGVGMTGVNDIGAIIGYDVPANKWVFGNTTRNSDLSTLEKIASITDITNYSGFVNNSFYPKNNPSGFITGVDLFNYVTKLNGQFIDRPTVNGTGILLSGEGGGLLPDTIVYTTGDQTISGNKTFISGLTILVQPTGTNPALNITGTWNNASQIYTGIALNIIDTASNSSSLLMDLKVEGASRFNATRQGAIAINNGTSTNTFNVYNNYGFGFTNSAGAFYSLQGNGIIATAGLMAGQNGIVGFGATTHANGFGVSQCDLVLERDAANILAQRRGINSQQFRIYNITGTNTGEFGLIGWQNNNFIVGSQQTQNGVLRDLTLTGANININASGQLNIFDPTNIIGNLTVSGNTTVTGHLAAATKSFLITHPIDSSKKLQYGSLESPYHGIRLTDRAKIVDDSAIVELPKYISSLVNDEKTNIQLTNINHSKVLFVKEVNVAQNYFVVGTDRGWFDSKEYEFYWSFTAERKDVPQLEVEF